VKAPSLLGEHGKAMIIAADHPARGANGVGPTVGPAFARCASAASVAERLGSSLRPVPVTQKIRASRTAARSSSPARGADEVAERVPARLRDHGVSPSASR
jgi:hypothetical protein